MNINLIQGDCLQVLKTLADNSVDSVVTDPPAGIGFMGKDWDGHKGGRKEWVNWLSGVMIEVYRVLKPGAYGLVWSLPRTSHWTACALEDAGFEIRDSIIHIFGSGFPKSLDVSKAINRLFNAEREVVGKSDRKNGSTGFTKGDLVPDITDTATEAAKQWDGFGTALKPAHETWWLIRKPLSEKTVAENVLKHGTGGLNIDECRVELQDYNNDLARIHKIDNGLFGIGNNNNAQQRKENGFPPQGRFPANVILDDSECVRALFPDTGNNYRPSGCKNTKKLYDNATWKMQSDSNDGFNDSGSAARFFYCAKASPADRNEGIENNHHPTVKNTNLMRYLCRLITPPGGVILDCFMGSGSTGKAAMLEGFSFIGIEQDEEYCNIASARIAAAKTKAKTNQQLTIF